MGTRAGAAPSAQAAQPQVGMSARGGFGDDGSYLMGEWFPVRVSLSNPQGGSTPSSAGARIAIAHMSLQDIPTLPAALNSLGALVLEDVDTGAGALGPEQLDALAAWVAQGGALIVVARPGGADVSSRLSELLPVKVGGTRSVSSLQGLADLVATPMSSTGSVLASESTLRTEPATGARLLASQDSV